MDRNRAADTILEKLPAAVFEYTYFPTGRKDFTYISAHCEVLFGFTSESLLEGSLPLLSFIHPDEQVSFIPKYESWLKNAENFNWEGRVVQSSGKIIWVSAIANASKMADGRVVWTGIFTDASAGKEAENRYQRLLETIPLGVGIIQNGVFVYVNENAAKIMGAKSVEELTGKPISAFIQPDKLLDFQERMKMVLSGKDSPPMDQRFIRLDGKEIYAETIGIPFTYKNQPAIQAIVKDVTEVRSAKMAIRKSEILFTQLFHNSPFGKVMLDETGKVLLVNQGFEKMFGYKLKELMGKGLNQFIVPADLQQEGSDLDTLISAREIMRIESVRMTKSQQKLSVLVYGVPISLDDKTIGIFGSYVDITDQKKTEEELKIRNAELDNFVYKVSHDLRAPLSSVLGLVNLAKMEGNDDSLAEYIKLIGQKIKQLDHFISDVLSHSKNLKVEVKIENIDFANLIEGAFTDLSYLKGAEAIKKTITVEGEKFVSDQWRMGEIFRNLVSNAIKYRDFEKVNPEINIDIKINLDRATIIFSDNGIGISELDQNKIFDMFYRASEQSDGSGLGLYIVKNAIDKLGGLLKVSSELGKGTTFELKLPNHILVISN